jgi:D-sedoheptulose 7-phosphate isomerase
MKTKIKKDAKKVHQVLLEGPNVYTFGNGGSCAIANHMAVDWTKNSGFELGVMSLCANAAMLTMIANDYGFEHTCSKQLLPLANNSVLVLISSSGNSKNIVAAAKAAQSFGIEVLGFTGFDGGELKKLSDVNVHIDSKDYGVVEDYHCNVMHEVARMLRSGK